MTSLTPGGPRWGPPWDHALRLRVNDLRVCARFARSLCGLKRAMNCGNALPRFTARQIHDRFHNLRHRCADLGHNNASAVYTVDFPAGAVVTIILEPRDDDD